MAHAIEMSKDQSDCSIQHVHVYLWVVSGKEKSFIFAEHLK